MPENTFVKSDSSDTWIVNCTLVENLPDINYIQQRYAPDHFNRNIAGSNVYFEKKTCEIKINLLT